MRRESEMPSNIADAVFLEKVLLGSRALNPFAIKSRDNENNTHLLIADKKNNIC